MLVYVPPTITYFYGFNRTLIRDDIIDNHHFSKSGFSGFSGTVKYLALCQILTPLIESSPEFRRKSFHTLGKYPACITTGYGYMYRGIIYVYMNLNSLLSLQWFLTCFTYQTCSVQPITIRTRPRLYRYLYRSTFFFKF